MCDEWFARQRELLARTAALCSAHHHAVHHGLMRLRDLRASMQQLLTALAKERRAAAAAAAAAEAAETAAAAAVAAAAAALAGGQKPPPAATASKDGGGGSGQQGGRERGRGQRRGGDKGERGQQGASGAVGQEGEGSASAGAAAQAVAAAAAVQQVETNLSRLSVAVVEMLKVVGVALAAIGEHDSIQGLYGWAVRSYEPLLMGAHLPGGSALAAAAAAAAASGNTGKSAGAAAAAAAATGQAEGHASSGRRRGSGDVLGAAVATPSGRSARNGSGGSKAAIGSGAGGSGGTNSSSSGAKRPQDPFSWLLALSLHTAGSYEQALLSYNAFLAPPPPVPTAPADSPRGGSGGPPPSARAAALSEMSSPAQAFVVERVAECYAALTDWSGLDGLTGAFEQRAAMDPGVGGWWPAVSTNIEHRFNSLAAYDMGGANRTSTAGPGVGGDGAAGSSSALLAALKALEAAKEAGGSSQWEHQQQQMAAARLVVSQELGQAAERLRAVAVSEPSAQRELLLHMCSLRGVARAMASHPGSAVPFQEPWAQLLLPSRTVPAVNPVKQGQAAPTAAAAAEAQSMASLGFGRALLAPDGGLQPSLVREAGTAAALYRVGRAADPRVAQPGTWALALEHIRTATATNNWGLAIRLVQSAMARVGASAAGGACGEGAGGLEGMDTGPKAVLAVAHSLVGAAAGRLQPQQVVELQLRALLPCFAPAPGSAAGLGTQPAGGEDLACALCTLARWMMRVGPVRQQQQQAGSAPPGFGAMATGVSAPGPAVDWPALTTQLLAELHVSYAPTLEASAPDAVQTPAAAFAPSNQALLQPFMPAAGCCLRALQLSAGLLSRAWKAWADLLFRATRERRARAPTPTQPASTTADSLANAPAASDREEDVGHEGYGAAVAAYCRYLTLSYTQESIQRPEDVLPVLLQVLYVVGRYGGPLEAQLAPQLAAVPPLAWASVVPQLLAKLPGAVGASRRLLAALLRAVGQAAPSLVLYPAMAEVRAADIAAAAAAGAEGAGGECTSVPELRQLLRELGSARPGLLSGVGVLVGELERLTVLWDERWAALLAELEVEVGRRWVFVLMYGSKGHLVEHGMQHFVNASSVTRRPGLTFC